MDLEGQPISAEVRGLQLRGLMWGDPLGPPVVAVHGWLDNAHSFAALAAQLPQLRWLAVEMPGHGRSQHHAADAEYHFVDYLKDLLGWLDALQLTKVRLVGHSMGACVSALFAGAFTERVDSLVLIDALAPPSAEASALPQQLRRHMRDAQRLARKQPRVHPSQAVFTQQLLKVVPGLPAAAAAALAARATVPAAAPAPAGSVQQGADLRLRATSLLRLTEAQVHAMLAQISAPCLLLRAQQGMPFDEAQLAARMACIGQLQVAQLPGGHHVHMEHPAAVAAVLQRFWRGG